MAKKKQKRRNSKSNTKRKNNFGGKSYIGILDVNRSGTGFVMVEGLKEDIKVSPHQLKTALKGDKVEVALTRIKKTGRKEGQITKVVERKTRTFVGEIELNKGFGFLSTREENLPDIYIDEKDLNGVKKGDKAVVRILNWGKNRKNPMGEVIAILNKEDKNDTAMKEILIEAGFPLKFPKEVLQETEELKEDFSSQQIKERKDLREVFTLTIDPADAKDFDDAISYRKIDNGLYEVGVHIADVSHYVQADTALDKEAYKRATSVYLADRVIPMLPEKISNELCSLRPDEDKMTFSAMFQISISGRVKEVWIGKTVIHSNKRLSYEEAQAIIEGKRGAYAEEIRSLNKISQKLRKKRFQKGAINFTSNEVRFQLDEQARPVGIVLKQSKEANQLIEELMLLANKAVATYADSIKIKKKPLPFPYRVHDTPDEEKLRKYVALATKIGYDFNISSPESIRTSFNELLEKVQGRPEQLLLEQLGIRTMSKAVYTTDNIGHYGLAFEKYCHFTSPIRRYPDIIVHRIISACLNGNPPKAKQETVEKQCRHCSDQERKAMEAERAAQKYKQVEYMRQYIGEEFDAVISGVAHFGFWAETIETKCEGMIALADLEEIDEFLYVDTEYALKGAHTGKIFRMGDTVRIRVAAAHLEKRQLDYVLV